MSIGTTEEIRAYAQGLRDMEQAVKRMIGMERFVKATHPEHAEATLASVVQTLIDRAPDPAPSETPEDAATATDALLEGIQSAGAEIERLEATVEAKQKSIEFWMTTPCSADHFDVRIRTLEEEAGVLSDLARQAQQMRQHEADRALTTVRQQLLKQIENEKQAAARARVTEAEKNLADPQRVDPLLRGGILASLYLGEMLELTIDAQPWWRSSTVSKVLHDLNRRLDEYREGLEQTCRDRAEREHLDALSS